jgi:hypothetical protein
MNIAKRIDQLVKEISIKTPGGNRFFDEIDSIIKNPKNLYIILHLFKKIYSDFGYDYNLVVSGEFGNLIGYLIKKGDIICKGTILQVSGGITSHFTDMDKIKKVKEVHIQKKRGEINNKDFIFVDDSYYSGTTEFSINLHLKKFKSRIIKTYIVYDGNDKKSKDRISLYNYYDWNVGSKRTLDDLMGELEKYDVPREIFREKIIKGDIISIIQLRKEINKFLTKSGIGEIDVYRRVRESKILKYDTFLESKIQFGDGWVKDRIDSRLWRYPIGNGFNCLIRKCIVKEEIINFTIYLEEPDGTLNYMDYLENPFIFTNISMNPLDFIKTKKDPLYFAIHICKRQLEYYDKLSELPEEEEINKLLYVFTDEDFKKNDIKYGYSLNISSPKEYNFVRYHNVYYKGEFVCVCYLTPPANINRDEIYNLVDDFKREIEINYEDLEIEYYYDERGLVLSIKKENYN